MKTSAAAQIQLYESIQAIPREVWNSMFPDVAEDWAYYLAAESCPPRNFTLGVLGARCGHALVAAAPIFRTSYELHNSAQGRQRRVADWMARRAPRLFHLPVISFGSPLVDRCHFGFAPGLDKEERIRLMGALLEGLRQTAARERRPLTAIKDLSNEDAEVFNSCLTASGFARITNVPMVYLDLPFHSEDAYLAYLPEKTSSYLRRKLRTLSRIEVEYRSSAEGLEPELDALYEATRTQSQVQYGDFDELHPRYFDTVLKNCGDKAQLMLCWLDGELVSFQLFMVGKDEVVAKFIGMRYPIARELNLYFINWVMMFRFCFERGIPRVRMGPTSYSVKLLLGGHLERQWIYFRHSNAILNWLFHRFAPLIDYEKNDPELSRMAKANEQIGK
jgi:hypothetical protein